MALKWNDLGGTAASAISSAIFSAPIVGVKTRYVLTQRFMQPIANFTALDMNTAHPAYTDYLIVEESPQEDIGGGLCTWERKYMKKPDQHIEFSSMVYNYIGFVDGVVYNTSTGNTTGRPFRDRFNRSVVCKTVFDYFIVPTDYSTIAEIPITEETRYKRIGLIESVYTDFLLPASSLPGIPTRTTPTVEGYLLLVAADAASQASYSIVAEASNLTRWMGQIFVRQTRYVKAL